MGKGRALMGLVAVRCQAPTQGVTDSLSAAGLTKLVADSAAPLTIRIRLSVSSFGRP